MLHNSKNNKSLTVHRIVRLFAFTISLNLLFSCSLKNSEEIIAAIQPFNNVDNQTCLELKSNIENYYGFKVYILPKTDIPKQFFINIKSPRYRADSTIKYLKHTKADSIDFVLGITTKDISTTKKDFWGNIKKPAQKYQDWGIFGLGYRPGPSCIVSSFRLGKGEQLKTRLQKVALHELGHNLGLKHCPNESCFMRDAAEKISTIDNVNIDLCSECKKYID